MKKMKKFRTKYDRKRVQFKSAKPSLACQEFKDEVDITKIMIRMKAGLDTTPSCVRGSAKPRQPMFGDFTGFGDYVDMRNKVNDARDRFDALPAHIRKYFGYDPASLLEAVNDPSRKDELTNLGIFVPKKEKVVSDTVATVNSQTDKEKGESASI